MNAKAARLVCTALLTAALAACASTPKKVAKDLGPEPLTPLDQYSIQVSRTPQQLALGIHEHGLSPNQQAALSDFFGRWRDNGSGDVEVAAPTDAPVSPVLAQKTAALALAYLERLGVPSGHLRQTSYDAHKVAGAPVIATFQAYEAVAPDCSKGWSDLTATKENKPQAHFGCAETANLAEMIANPRDLVTPAAEEPADNSRRQVVIGKYRQGATTSTSADTQASGTVSGSSQ